MTQISNIGAVRTVVETLLEKDVRQVVISPGSRNAPFILSFTAIDAFECHHVLDERSAAFIALGMAQRSGRPVVLCCTSGSAILNYSPALVEAYYQRIPLIVVTADRPDEWIDQGEGQSIRQRGLLDGVVMRSFHLAQGTHDDDRWFNQRQVAEAVEEGMSGHGRPVHINVPLREPLYELEERQVQPRPSMKRVNTRPQLEGSDQLALSSAWASAGSIAILVSQGRHSPGLKDQLRVLNDDPRVAVLTETTANVQHLGFVCCIDRTIESFIGTEAEARYVPELLITVGENIISKKIKALFRRQRKRIRHHWHLGEQVLDTFQALTHVIPVGAVEFLRKLIEVEVPENGSRFGVEWRSRFFLNEQLHDRFLEKTPYSDLKAFELILDFVPDGAQVQMGNSSVVRYVQLFNQLANVRYFGNRGVSGIEGCVSTAVGAAMNADEPVIHISGDHAFRYDSNALASGLPKNLRVIVINNGGGNIFRIIPGPSRHEASEAFIEAANERSVRGLVEHYGAYYLEARDLESLERALEQLIDPARQQCTVLEVFTPRTLGPEVLAGYFDALKGGDL